MSFRPTLAVKLTQVAARWQAASVLLCCEAGWTHHCWVRIVHCGMHYIHNAGEHEIFHNTILGTMFPPGLDHPPHGTYADLHSSAVR